MSGEEKVKIIWSTNVDPSGYSSCARSYLKALYTNKNCDIRIIINNIARNINLQGIDKKDILLFSKISTDKPLEGYNLVQHCVPDRMIFGVKKHILYTVVELPCSKRWVNICNQCDIIMTASSFCRDIMKECGVDEKRLSVIPHCHDSKIWNQNVKPLNIKNLKEFNFLFVGDYTPRKGGDILVKNFCKTFTGYKDVSLTIKGYYNSFSQDDQERLIKRIRATIESSGIAHSDLPSIYFYGEPISEMLMPRFMQSFDCLVSPHRGEGWGLSMSQAMFLGKPVIATGYSGNLDFMSTENSFLIKTDGFEPVCREMLAINPNYEGQDWIRVDERSLCELMEYVYLHKDYASRIGQMAAVDLKDRFSSDRIAEQILTVLK